MADLGPALLQVVFLLVCSLSGHSGCQALGSNREPGPGTTWVLSGPLPFPSETGSPGSAQACQAQAVTHRRNQRSPSPNLRPQIPERGHRQRGSFFSSITVVATTCGGGGQKRMKPETGCRPPGEWRGLQAEGRQWSNSWETWFPRGDHTPELRLVASASSPLFCRRE